MKSVTYTGGEKLSPAVRLSDGSGKLILLQGIPCQVSDQTAADLLASGPEFIETKSKEPKP